VTVRLLCLCAALLVVFAGVALGEGTYQRTKNGKTIVWNDDPKPGDVATWFGDQDKENYATGVGTLTWRTAKGNVYGRYFGNMVRGKFDGVVNVHSKGKTGHAVFSDGRPTGRWTPGPAPSRTVAEQRPKPAKPEVTASPEVAAIPEASATPKTIANGAANPESVREQTPPPPKEDKPAEGPSPGKTSDVGGRKPVAATTPPVSEAVSSEKTKITVPETPAPKKSQVKAENSLQSLVGPPSSLRATPAPDAASTSSANAQLTQEEAIALADAEARTEGYAVDEYERPKADYSRVKDKWSLVYDLTDATAASENPRHFTMTVEDKTKKVEMRK
jgi:hypothetical protein